MTQRVSKVIDLFLDALNEGTLAKGSCVACAVGNIVAEAQGGTIYKESGDMKCTTVNNIWWEDFVTVSNGLQIKKYNPAIGKQIAYDTDFTYDELAKIEYAFETAAYIHIRSYSYFLKEEIRADQIKGLEAAVKVMLSFEDSKEDVKEVFTKRAELIPLSYGV